MSRQAEMDVSVMSEKSHLTVRAMESVSMSSPFGSLSFDR